MKSSAAVNKVVMLGIFSVCVSLWSR